MSATPTFASRRAGVERGRRRARWAVGAVVVAAGMGAIGRVGGIGWLLGPAGIRSLGPAIVILAGLAPRLSELAAAVLFLVWVHRAVANARALEAPLAWSAGQAVLAYLVPVVSLILPYYVMKSLYRASDPSALSDPPVFRERTDASYRDGARELVAPPLWILPAPILAWWILFDARSLLGWVPIVTGGSGDGWFGASCDVASGALCVLVIRSIDARQRERCRRLEASERAPAR